MSMSAETVPGLSAAAAKPVLGATWDFGTMVIRPSNRQKKRRRTSGNQTRVARPTLVSRGLPCSPDRALRATAAATAFRTPSKGPKERLQLRGAPPHSASPLLAPHLALLGSWTASFPVRQ